MTINKRLYIFLTAILFCVFLAIPALAGAGFNHEYNRVLDRAGLLSDNDFDTLTARLDEISDRQKIDIVVATTDTLYGEDIVDYADGLYDFCKYGYGENRDGLILVISTEENDWYISTHGYGIEVFTDAGIQYIGSQMTEELSDGDFAAAFNTFADLCDDFITQAREGIPYDSSSLPRKPLSMTWLPISLVIGLIIALIAVGIMISQLKTVRFQAAAGDYMKKGSLKITEKRDLFLYRTMSRRERPKKTNSGGRGGSSIHMSSSGSTHGGGGGKF